MPIHGTIAARPVEVFNKHELPVLLPCRPPYDIPLLRSVKVHRDHHLLTELTGVSGHVAGVRPMGGLTVSAMFDEPEVGRAAATHLRVLTVGSLLATGSKWEPYQLLDAVSCPVGPAAAFIADLLAAGRSDATVRSYGMDLLRWFRFLWSIQTVWDRATRVEARDFSRWMAVPGRGGVPVFGGGAGAQ